LTASTGEDQSSDTAITDPHTWRVYECRLVHPDSTETRVVLLRPVECEKEFATGHQGSTLVFLHMEEYDAAGWATVEAVRPCPEIAPGAGRVVTSLFHHSISRQLRTLTLSGGDGKSDTLHVTKGHPVWSATRQQWVPAGELRPGEMLNTREQGVVTVTSLTSDDPAATFNIKVETEHLYRVGAFGTLVHNQSNPALRASNRCPHEAKMTVLDKEGAPIHTEDLMSGGTGKAKPTWTE
jgi:hypothetical protein